MKTLILAFLLSLPALAQDTSASRLFNVSQATLVASNIVDAGSSWGKYETNPILGRGEFGMRQLAIKSGITAGLVFAERPLARKSKAARIGLTIANFVASGVLVGTAYRNMQVK